ncbi:MAG: NAD(P)-dependent alcohol dehydrogenase [Myxococcaceae bacterium]|nr:NAD(P)-dependent alcohol dehydrogenase [Myxococcaceae bacterium]
MKVRAWATMSADSKLVPFSIDRRDPTERDVEIEILWSGICHSDIHQARGEWGRSAFPMVPGHEIVGRVTRVGAKVTKFAPGDLAGVGCMVDACRTCTPCTEHHEQFCEAGPAWTYNGTELDRKTPTFGGYSTHVVVTEHFVVKVPSTLELSSAAPLLCAGITTWSPLKQWAVTKGSRVGVVGLGGLGHMAVKLAHALGAEVTMLSTSAAKKADAQRLGASDFALTTERATFKTHAGRFDLLIDTVAATHDVDALFRLLKPFGALVIVGIPPKSLELKAGSLVGGNKRFAGSSIGGMRETQEVLDFCGQHRIGADVEVIPAEAVNTAYERMIKNDVRYRFVIDAKTI